MAHACVRSCRGSMSQCRNGKNRHCQNYHKYHGSAFHLCVLLPLRPLNIGTTKGHVRVLRSKNTLTCPKCAVHLCLCSFFLDTPCHLAGLSCSYCPKPGNRRFLYLFFGVSMSGYWTNSKGFKVRHFAKHA